MQFHGVSKRLGVRLVLDRVSFVVNDRETTGVVGANGSGKSTLLKIGAGVLLPDAGAVQFPPTARLGCLPQNPLLDPRQSLSRAFPALFPEGNEQRLEELAMALAAAGDEAWARLATEYDTLLARLSLPVDRAALEAGTAALELRAFAGAEPAGVLSGGEATKLTLLDVVAGSPTALLLDEPTNHLDVRGIEWLEAYVRAFTGPALIVSHDRTLLDRLCGAIVEIDGATGWAEEFPGTYSDFADEKARREEEAWLAYERQRKEERRLRQAIAKAENQARRIENTTIHFHYRKRAKKVASQAVNLRSRLERQAARGEKVGRPAKGLQAFGGQFGPVKRGARRLLSADRADLVVGGRPLLREALFQVNRGEQVFLTGPNGCGKTSLLRAVLGELTPAAGTITVGPSVQIGYLPQTPSVGQEAGEQELTALELLRRSAAVSETDASNFLHRFLFDHDQATTPLRALSLGERQRLALARFVLAGVDLLLLDEPTNHLDIPSREAFEAALQEFEGGALVVTHDRYFTERLADTVLEFDGGRLRTRS